VAVPKSTGVNPAANEPSHLQQVQAELVARLPVPDPVHGGHHVLPTLRSEQDYDAYIEARTAQWNATLSPSGAEAPRV
jgi:hypothetical protein